MHKFEKLIEDMGLEWDYEGEYKTNSTDETILQKMVAVIKRTENEDVFDKNERFLGIFLFFEAGTLKVKNYKKFLSILGLGKEEEFPYAFVLETNIFYEIHKVTAFIILGQGDPHFKTRSV